MTDVDVRSGPMWLYGVHGGAGVTSLLRAGVPAADSHGQWPSRDQPAMTVVVCRSHMTGLEAAITARVEVARGIAPACVELVGLVVINDAPKLTRPLRAQRIVSAGDYPRVWHVGWLEEWRGTRSGSTLPVPPSVQMLRNELRELMGSRFTGKGPR